MGKKSESGSSSSTSQKNESILKSLLILEPALVIHMMACVMVFMSVQDLLLEKACRVNYAYSDKVCDALQARETEQLLVEEQAVQKLIGTALMYRTVLENLFPIFLILLIGAWSDKYGRKLPMLFVLASFILQNIGLILSVYFNKTMGVWSVALISSLIPALSGNTACYLMSAFSHLSDTTSAENKTTRTGIAHTFMFLGVTLGLAAGGILSQTSLGFTNIFAIGIALEAYAFIHVFFLIKPVRDEKAIKDKTVLDMTKDLFHLKHISDAAYSVVKKRPGNTRLKLWLLFLTHACVMSTMMGENGVMYLFSRLQFNWDAGSFGSYMTFKMIVGFFGNFLAMGLLIQKLKLPDHLVGIIANVSALIASLMFAMAQTSFLMYLGPIVAILSGPNMIVPRSSVSKIIPAAELGKVNSFMGSMDAIIPLVASPLYTMLYKSTLDVLPGAFFLMSAFLFLLPILTHWWFWSSEKEAPEKKKD